MPWRWLLLILIGYGSWHAWSGRAQSQPTGVIAANAPRQVPVERPVRLEKNGYSLEPLARFEVEARVLGKEQYSVDREAKLAPVDLALGWGRMSDSAVLKKVSISQGNRFYYWRVDDFPIPQDEIVSSSGNMHMIPADAAIEKRLKAVRPGQVVSVSGYLVEASSQDGWRWRSSLSRTDTGFGACELVWVEDLSVR